MNGKIGFILFCIIPLFFACSKENDCFHSIGKQTTITILSQVKSDTLWLTEDIDIEVEIGRGDESVILYGGENILKNIELIEENNRISFVNKNKCGFLRDFKKSKVKAVFKTTTLPYLHYKGTGNVVVRAFDPLQRFFMNMEDGAGDISLNIDVDSLIVKQHTGAASFAMKGNVNNAFYYMGGNGPFHCEKAKHSSVYVNHNGTSDIWLNVTNTLRAEIFRIGNIRVKGNPSTIIERIEGDGRVIRY